MDNHEEWKIISAYLDDEVNSEEKGRVESHLNHCGTCKNELNSLQRTKQILTSVSRVSMPLDVQDNILNPKDGVSVLETVRKWWNQPRVWVPVGTLATAALFVGIWFGLNIGAEKEPIPLAPLLAAHSRYTAESLVPRHNVAISNYSYQLEKIDEAYH